MSSAFKPIKKVAGAVFDPFIGAVDSVFGGGDSGSFSDALKGVADPLLAGAPIPASAESPPNMPLRNDAAVRSASRRSRQKQSARRGRRSTILTPFNVESEGLLGE